MKTKLFLVRYMALILCICFLLALTMCLPLLSFFLSDERQMKDSNYYDFQVNTYDGREIPLEERIGKLAKLWNDGMKPAFIPIPEVSDVTAEQLCEIAVEEMRKMPELPFWDNEVDRTYDYLESYQKYNIVAGYSSKVWRLEWVQKREYYERRWVMLMDCETNKILAVQYRFREGKYFVGNSASVTKAKDTEISEMEQVAKWVDYLGFGEVVLNIDSTWVSKDYEFVSAYQEYLDSSLFLFLLPKEEGVLPVRVRNTSWEEILGFGILLDALEE